MAGPDTTEFPEPRNLALALESRRPLTPMLARLRLIGDDLSGFHHLPGQDLMLAVPTATDPGVTINRRYTIRRYDPAASAVDVDIVLHGDGPGARWARDAAPGSPIDAVGPRGKIVPDPAAEWHLFACDESGWAATAAMAEALPADRTALVFAEIDGPQERQPLTTDAALTVEWVERGGRSPGDPAPLADAIRAAVGAGALPGGSGHAYLSAEFSVVRGLADLLGGAGGLSSDQISPKAYWRLGRANAPHGEPPRELS